ncbi:hypothetical protein CC85DRAFT_299239 [Cutaneotrichosporon oleaginosum]|uniref:Uncharacterized protein n=1 Tax=Cutaneotrichosporon oleaginosum TaxID=879819 RepID=A0A0J1BC33_9TREE|nr:uncharacterized protein CC85DRAFT_299239 [Cutaneotrichosporon oleaginosum]KLT45579.1 hypothetical protein CC85DRAFT_299239 [Cutaneotrichosporon oleaginosum]TXT04624.1 hypothetical protein COLE_07443 [Cutaneotrichosporon oleaginosum]
MPTVPIHTIRPLLDLVDFAELAEYVRERARSPPLCGTPSGPTTRAPSADHSPERGCAVLPSSPPLPQLSLPTAASASGPASHPTSPPRSDAPPPPSTPGKPLQHVLHVLGPHSPHTPIRDMPRLKLLRALRAAHLWPMADPELARFVHLHQDMTLGDLVAAFPPGRVPVPEPSSK